MTQTQPQLPMFEGNPVHVSGVKIAGKMTLDHSILAMGDEVDRKSVV